MGAELTTHGKLPWEGSGKYKQTIHNDLDQDVTVEWGQGTPYPNNPQVPLKAGAKLRMTPITDNQYHDPNYQFPVVCVIPNATSAEATKWSKQVKFCQRNLHLPGDNWGKAQTYTTSEVLREGAICSNYDKYLKEGQKLPENGPNSATFDIFLHQPGFMEMLKAPKKKKATASVEPQSEQSPSDTASLESHSNHIENGLPGVFIMVFCVLVWASRKKFHSFHRPVRLQGSLMHT